MNGHYGEKADFTALLGDFDYRKPHGPVGTARHIKRVSHTAKCKHMTKYSSMLLVGQQQSFWNLFR